MLDPALDYTRAHREDALADLCELLRIPSISTQPDYAPYIAQAADWVAAYCRRIGLENVAVMPTTHYPVVVGDWLHAGEGAFTLLIYGHYDVQPPDPLHLWTSPPFEPTVRGEHVFARGASDDKGQFMAALKAVEAYLRTSSRLPVNVKVIIEGEEEIAGPGIPGFIRANTDRLAADAVLICDNPMLAPDQPLILYAVRGNCYVEVSVSGPATDLHSGTYGGGVENPFNVLVRLLAQVQDAETRRINIPGFYDSIRPIDLVERARINSGIVSDAVLRAATGVPQPAGEAGFTSAERVAIRPTFEICGMPGGYMEAGRKSVIPAVAQAKVSFRLVPDQDPVDIAARFEAFLRAQCPPTVTLSVTSSGFSWPVLMDPQTKAIQAADQAFERVFGRPAVYMRGGGSLPIAHDFRQALGVDIVMAGLGLLDDNLHAPDEKFFLPNYYNGIEAIIRYLALLAE